MKGLCEFTVEQGILVIEIAGKWQSELEGRVHLKERRRRTSAALCSSSFDCTPHHFIRILVALFHCVVPFLLCQLPALTTCANFLFFLGVVYIARTAAASASVFALYIYV